MPLEDPPSEEYLRRYQYRPNINPGQYNWIPHRWHGNTAVAYVRILHVPRWILLQRWITANPPPNNNNNR